MSCSAIPIQPSVSNALVVGAGLSGLCAARKLCAAGKSVIVLEGSERVGGRISAQSIPFGGSDASFDMGAAYIGVTQESLFALGHELGLDMNPDSPTSDLVAARDTGAMVLYWDDQRHPQSPNETLPTKGLNVLSLLGIDVLFEKHIVPDAKTLEKFLEDPWNAPNAAAWDRVSVDDWLNRHMLIDESAKEMVRVAVRCVWSAEANEISLLYFFWYIACAGGLDVILGCHGNGAQTYQMKSGTDMLPNLVAKDLSGNIRFSAPVTAISVDGGSATVETLDGSRYRAPAVVVAMSPYMSSRIQFSPALPIQRVSLVQRMPIGRTIKTICTYDQPFWRDQYCGMAVSNCTFPVWTMDDTTANGCAAMMAFVVGDRATELGQLPMAQRREAIVQALSTIYGDERFLHPVNYIDKDWNSDPWACGCPVGMTAPGALTRFGPALRQSVGPIHWAGTETATVWQGYMDGAINAGYRAAAEVLAS